MDPFTAFLTSITTALGQSHMALAYAYASGIAINLLSGKIERDWDKRRQADADHEAELILQLEQSRPLREDFARVAVNATRVAARLGMDEQSSAILGLIQDDLFQAEMLQWLLSANDEEEKAAAKVLAQRFLAAFNSEDLSARQTSEFMENFFEISKRFLFSDPRIVAWRGDLRDRYTQRAIQTEGQLVRKAIDQSESRVLTALDSYLGPLVPTIADDVKSFRDKRDEHLALVASTSEIQLDGREIKIRRTVAASLAEASLVQSLLITGEPGSGKSIALTELVTDLRRSGYDILYLDVQRLSSESLGELKNELGLEFSIAQVFADWPGRDEVILCIDGLDAARSSDASRMMRDLIQLTLGYARWRVVASIRKFDLRHSAELRQFFQGPPPCPTFIDQEFGSIRHVNLGLLDDLEVNEFKSQSNSLNSLIEHANESLQEQLRVPFNIWLAASVIDSGGAQTLFAPIKTQLQLLELYWKRRVIRDDDQGDAREGVAFSLAKQMVSRRELKASRVFVTQDASASAPLRGLLSSNVICEWMGTDGTRANRYFLAFPHNVLFDFAASLAVFQDNPGTFLDALRDDPTLMIFALPSVRFFLQRLWFESGDHQRFWDVVHAVAHEPSVEAVCKLIGPAVAVELATSIEEFAPVFAAMAEVDPERAKAAIVVAQHISGAVLTGSSLVRSRNLWIDWTERLSADINDQLAPSIYNLLGTFIVTIVVGEQKLARVSQTLVKYALARPEQRGYVFREGCAGLCLYGAENPEFSAALLRQALSETIGDEQRVKNFGFVVKQIAELSRWCPELVRDVCVTLQRLRYSQDVSTRMGRSLLLQLSSNLRQDHQHVLYDLTERFPAIIRMNLNLAIEILENAIEVHHYLNDTGGVVLVEGTEYPFVGDHSQLWDEDLTGDRDHTLRLLTGFSNWLDEISDIRIVDAGVSQLLNVFRTIKGCAALYRRVLNACKLHPSTLGLRLVDLLTNETILTSAETRGPARDAVAAIFALLEREKKVHVERAILTIQGDSNTYPGKEHMHIRSRLLQMLERDAIVQSTTRDAYDLAAVSTNEDDSEQTIETRSDEEIDAKIPSWRTGGRTVPTSLRPLFETLDGFLKVSGHGIEPVLTSLEDTWRSIVEQVAEVSDRDLRDWLEEEAGRRIVSFVTEALKDPNQVLSAGAVDFCSQVLRAAAIGAKPVFDADRNVQFDNHGDLYRGQARTEAAIGIMRLIQFENGYSNEICESIHSLSEDSCNSVRALIIEKLNRLELHDATLMWEIITKVAASDPSYFVSRKLVTHTLIPRSKADTDRILPLAKKVFERFPEKEKCKSAREACLSLFLTVFVGGSAMAEDYLHEIVSSPEVFSFECRQLVADALHHLNRAEPALEDGRKRIWGLVARIVNTAVAKWKEIGVQLQHIGGTHVPNEMLDTYKSVGWILVEAMKRIYFTSGASDHLDFTKNRATAKNTPSRTRYWMEAQPVLDVLQSVGIPEVAHDGVETLVHFIDLDPAGVFKRIARFIEAGSAFAYQSDFQACEILVKVVERYLAEHRDIFKDGECQRLLLMVLGLFVDWPVAKSLIYRLQDIYR